jgi:hypothetical protein
MNTQDAAYHTVHDYLGGASSLAPRLGMPVGVLNSKVNPNTPTHHLSLAESVRLMVLTADHRILRAQCDELGYLPPIPRVTCEVSDLALLETYTRLISELGEFSQAFHTALADGRLTLPEVARLEKEMLDFFAAGEELLTRAKSIAR